MADNCLTIEPGCVLEEGDIVVIEDYGSKKWIVCYGWYTYSTFRRQGWYFKGIETGDILPVDQVNMSHVHIVSHGHHHHHHPSNCFVTVGTIAERNEISMHNPPNGKLVRVNYVEGKIGPQYYEWNATDFKWDLADFSGGGVSPETIEEMKEDISNLQVDVRGLSMDMTSAKSDISGLKSEVSGLTTSVTTLTERVDSLENWVYLDV